MTIFEVFPWLLAILIAVVVGSYFTRTGHSGVVVSILAVIAAVIVILAHRLFLKSMAAFFERRKIQNEKWDIESREYQTINFSAPFPSGNKLFYECGVCGNSIPSEPKKPITCKCRNIVIDPPSRHIEVRDRTRVKLFRRI